MGAGLDAVRAVAGGAAMGEREKGLFQVSFNSSLKIDFSRVHG